MQGGYIAITTDENSQHYSRIIPVPGGVGLRTPVATSRLELPPDLLLIKATESNIGESGKIMLV